MYRKIKQHKKKVVALALILILGTLIISRRPGNDNENDFNQNQTRNVDVLVRGTSGFEARINTSGEVTSNQRAQIRSEITGNIISVPARVGSSISQGTILASFSASDAQNAVRQAEAGLNAARAQLNELERNSVTGSNTASLKNQQETIVQNAFRTLLNTDLRAYPLDRAEETRANPPIISGTYIGLEEGEYVIETYASGALSGASFRLSGLEIDTQPINAFDNAVPLGTKGLQITFPREGDSSLVNQRWVIPIPNIRSSQYASALNNYNSALSNKDVSLNQAIISEDQLESARASVQQAEANLSSAQTQLARTSVRAPFAGEIVSVNVGVGDFVSAGLPIATVVNKTQLYLQSFVSSSESRSISLGDRVVINRSIDGKVSHISSGINPTNGKIEIHISINQGEDLISGEFVDVEIILKNLSDESILLLPLQAVQPRLQGSFIYVIEGNMAKSFAVETGKIIGEYIEILTEIPEETIIASSARGLRDGIEVNIE